MSNFKGRVAVITGGASGFGKESAQILAKEGAKLVLWDIVDAQGEALAKSIRETGAAADFLKVDVRSAAQVKLQPISSKRSTRPSTFLSTAPGSISTRRAMLSKPTKKNMTR